MQNATNESMQGGGGEYRAPGEPPAEEKQRRWEVEMEREVPGTHFVTGEATIIPNPSRGSGNAGLSSDDRIAQRLEPRKRVLRERASKRRV